MSDTSSLRGILDAGAFDGEGVALFGDECCEFVEGVEPCLGFGCANGVSAERFAVECAFCDRFENLCFRWLIRFAGVGFGRVWAVNDSNRDSDCIFWHEKSWFVWCVMSWVIVGRGILAGCLDEEGSPPLFGHLPGPPKGSAGEAGWKITGGTPVPPVLVGMRNRVGDE